MTLLTHFFVVNFVVVLCSCVACLHRVDMLECCFADTFLLCCIGVLLCWHVFVVLCSGIALVQPTRRKDAEDVIWSSLSASTHLSLIFSPSRNHISFLSRDLYSTVKSLFEICCSNTMRSKKFPFVKISSYLGKPSYIAL